MISRIIFIGVWVALFGDIGILIFTAVQALVFATTVTEQLGWGMLFLFALGLGFAIAKWLEEAESMGIMESQE